jgi:hypothetical protein
VAAYSNSHSGGDGGAAALVPGGWIKGPVTFGIRAHLDGASAPDGSVGFCDDYGNVNILGKNGWTSSTIASNVGYSKNSIAFTKDSQAAVLAKAQSNSNLTLYVQSGSEWYSSTVSSATCPSINSSDYAVDFDSYGQANIIFNNSGKLAYAQKGIFTGNQWQINISQTAPAVLGPMDLAISSNDTPFAAYATDRYLFCAVYNKYTADWTTTILDNYFYSYSGGFQISADTKGGIGIAYVDAANMLSYIYSNGSGWTLPEKLTKADYYNDVGLAFDYENNPVISYSYQGKMYIAYDPVPAPEPATIGLLAIGLAFIKRNGK